MRTLSRSTRPAPATQGMTLPSLDVRSDAADVICERLMDGWPLDEICESDGMPSRRAVLRWINTDAAFKQRFLEAQRVRVFAESASLLDIADGPGEIARDRLRIDTRLKLLAKLEPDVFGDRVEHDHTVTGELASLLAGAMDAGHGLPHEQR